MSMFPIMLGALSVIGLAIRDPGAYTQVQGVVLQVFPSSAQPELQKALEGVRESAGWFGLASLLGVLWSASSIFGALEFAMTRVFGTTTRRMLRQRLMGFAVVLVLVAAIGATLLINTAAGLLGIAWLSTAVSFVAGAALMVILLAAMYRFVPNRRLRVRDVLPGAVVAGVGIELLSLAFPLYAWLAHGFNTYGAQFALFFLLATWFYLLSQLVLLGAVFNKVRLDSSRDEPPVEARAAVGAALVRRTRRRSPTP
jgi:YihY family inner membrane protein